MPDEVLTWVADCVAALTINRPEPRNALSPSALEALRAEFVQLGSDPEVCAIVLTGEGDRAICSGADVGFSQALEFPRSPLTINLLTEDSAEGLQAFREKREPNFRRRQG
jgi:enoyl-CoA hydratase/carnithine racemase